MSETNSATATESVSVPMETVATVQPIGSNGAAHKRKAKPKSKKTKVKAKTKVEKPAAKKERKVKTKPEILVCKGQVRILAALAKQDTPLLGDRLTKLSKMASRAWLSEYLGTKDSENDGFIMRKGERTNVRKLIPSGLVKAVKIKEESDGINETRYEITSAGKAKLEKLTENKDK